MSISLRVTRKGRRRSRRWHHGTHQVRGTEHDEEQAPRPPTRLDARQQPMKPACVITAQLKQHLVRLTTAQDVEVARIQREYKDVCNVEDYHRGGEVWRRRRGNGVDGYSRD